MPQSLTVNNEEASSLIARGQAQVTKFLEPLHQISLVESAASDLARSDTFSPNMQQKTDPFSATGRANRTLARLGRQPEVPAGSRQSTVRPAEVPW